MSSRRQILTLGAAAIGAPFALPSFAQGFPSRAVRIVVPFGPGGVADLTARTVGQKLAEKLGQAVVVENKPGAGGVTAGDMVVHAEPDGHTLLLMSNGTAVSAGLFRKLPFDAEKDFAPVSLLGTFDMGVVVPDNSRFRTLQDLLAAARAAPGKLNVATINVGSTQNLAAELFRTTAGIDVQVVPFNGTPAVVTALRAGQVDAAVEILGPIKGQITSRALRVLATMGASRSPGMDDVPTVSEAGGALKGFDVASWNALAAPAKTPPAAIQRLNRDVQAVLADPDTRKKLAEINIQAKSSTPEQLGKLLSSEIQRWSGVIERAKIPKQ